MVSGIHPFFNLTDRVAIVTGGGSGLGREFCDVLAEFGANVICPDINIKGAEETCQIIKKYGHEAIPMHVDISKYDQIQAMFKQVMDKFGKLDILVNNAGIAPPPLLIGETKLSDWHRVIDVDLHGVFYCLREALILMKEQGKGSIINISSVGGLFAVPPTSMPQAAYIAAKHAVIGLTKQAAAEYGQFGIRINCIAPGLHVGTGLPASMGIKLEKKGVSDIISQIALRRAAQPSELKGLLLYLVSDCASFMTGATVIYDGGMSIC
jgi:NAD(P)-dependent dehydrogenase (short-subunit alcohol dehydrogenase family)